MTKIAELRQKKGISVPALSRLANMHPTNVYRLNAGTYKAGESVQTRFAEALGSSPEDLFDADGWPLEAGETANV
jgi:transcriptional regulator with XRE-family HTH domain